MGGKIDLSKSQLLYLRLTAGLAARLLTIGSAPADLYSF